MTHPRLIVLGGAPCTGKSSLAKHLAETYPVVSLSKDTVKELLFDAIELAGPDAHRLYGQASVRLHFLFAQSVLAAGQNLLMEGNFENPMAQPFFDELQAKTPHRTVQLICSTDLDILYERNKARTASGTRHSKHRDGEATKEEIQAYMAARNYRMNLPGGTYEIDTGDFDAARKRVVEAVILRAVRPQTRTGRCGVSPLGGWAETAGWSPRGGSPFPGQSCIPSACPPKTWA